MIFRRGAFGAAETQQFACVAPSAPPIVGLPTTSNGGYGSVLSCGHFPAAVTIHCSDALRHGVTPRCSPALSLYSACPGVRGSGACGSIAVKCLWQGGLICIRPPTGWMGKIRAAKGRGSCQSIGNSGEVGPHRIHTKPNNCSRLREGEMLQLIISP